MVSLWKKHTTLVPGSLPLLRPVDIAPPQCGVVPYARVLHHADAVEQLCKEGVYLDVDGNELPQCIGRLQPDAPVGILEGFGEGGLKLGQEGLQGNPNLWETSRSLYTDLEPKTQNHHEQAKLTHQERSSREVPSTHGKTCVCS